jgi:hypothetical protein
VWAGYKVHTLPDEEVKYTSEGVYKRGKSQSERCWEQEGTGWSDEEAGFEWGDARSMKGEVVGSWET